MPILEGQVAIVTGASRGIGKAAAIELASSGAAVVVNYRSRSEDAQQVVETIRQNGGCAEACAGDVSSETDVRELVRFALRKFGVVDIDREHRITGFLEKPKQTAIRSPYDPTKISASMCIYIFKTDVLIPVLLKDAEDPDSSHDFGKNILPKMLDDYRVFSFNFVDENKKEALYWRDVGTLEAYYEANMDLVSVSPVFNLYDDQWPIRTHQRQYPPAKFVFAESGRMGRAVDSLVSSGCIISGGSVQACVLSPDVRVNSYTEIESSILFSHVNVGRSCRIRKAIIDRDVHIPEGTTIGYDAEADRERYFVTDGGITVVTRDYSLFENPVTVDYFTSE